MKMNVLKATAVLVLVLVATASADNTWTGAAGDGLWSTGGNWSTGVAPVDSDINVFFSNGSTITVDSSTNTSINCNLYGPEWGTDLVVDGGSLTQVFDSSTYYGFVFAPIGASDNHSTITVKNGGTLHVQELLLGDNWWYYTAPYVDLNVYDTSSVIANGWCWLGGTINLYGGTVDIGGGFNMDVHGMGYALIDIYEGTLIIRGGDYSASIATWIANGQLVAFGGTGTILVDTTTISGATIITAIPEPATMLILGLGTLFVSRTRKA